MLAWTVCIGCVVRACFRERAYPPNRDRLSLPLLEGPPLMDLSTSPMGCCVAGGLEFGADGAVSPTPQMVSLMGLTASWLALRSGAVLAGGGSRLRRRTHVQARSRSVRASTLMCRRFTEGQLSFERHDSFLHVRKEQKEATLGALGGLCRSPSSVGAAVSRMKPHPHRRYWCTARLVAVPIEAAQTANSFSTIKLASAAMAAFHSFASQAEATRASPCGCRLGVCQAHLAFW